MTWLAGAILAGILSFTATNIDDIIILMIFFAQVNASFRPQHIVAGQYLGFTALIIASLPGFFGGLILPKEWIGLLGFLPIAVGLNHLLNSKDENEVQAVSQEMNPNEDRSSPSILSSFLNPKTYSVATVTFANGGDNIGIYLPLFASSPPWSLAAILTVFYILIGVWCYTAYRLTRQPAIAQLLSRYTKAVVPFVLMALGLYILIESGTYRLLAF